MNQPRSMKDLPTCERPYEKFLSHGAASLSDAELLAVILRTGTKSMNVIDVANEILSYSSEFPGLLVLHHISLKELTNVSGIGTVKAIQILCIAELNKRMTKAKRKDGVRLLSPETVASYYMEDMRHLTTEQILLVMIDSKSKIIKEDIISTGTVNASILAPREIFIKALSFGAVNIILLHNHPSGDPTPSTEDIKTTNRIKEAGSIIGIKLMDHIIIGDNKYISLKEIGLL
ncbi:MAG: DNA repair protein RadC [bacterium]|nr:DNA repair protein RadC [bacterium]